VPGMEDAGQVTRDALKICSRDPKCPWTVAIQSKPPVHQLRLRSRLDRIVPLFSSTACFDRILTWQTDAVMTRVTNQRIRGPINKTTTNEKRKQQKRRQYAEQTKRLRHTSDRNLKRKEANQNVRNTDEASSAITDAAALCDFSCSKTKRDRADFFPAVESSRLHPDGLLLLGLHSCYHLPFVRLYFPSYQSLLLVHILFFCC
jgi:hypothetical protein